MKRRKGMRGEPSIKLLVHSTVNCSTLTEDIVSFSGVWVGKKRRKDVRGGKGNEESRVGKGNEETKERGERK